MEKEKVLIKAWFRESKNGNLLDRKSFTVEVEEYYGNEEHLLILYKIYREALSYARSFSSFGYGNNCCVVIMISPVDELCSSFIWRYCDLIKTYLEFTLGDLGEVDVMVVNETETDSEG